MSSQKNNERTGLEIAVIGMSCRFPGADNYNEFWRNICAGVESVELLGDAQLISNGVSEGKIKNANYIKSASLLKDIKLFDADFFGITKREAELTDPQQRILLEQIWQALEDAGCDPYSFEDKIALFAGCGVNTYLFSNLINNKSYVQDIADLNVYITNHVDSLATRVAYKLDLIGPAISVQTACSTSLVAIHLACQSLLTGDAEVAIAGAVKVSVPHSVGYIYQEDGIRSKDGHCRPFDDDASGTVFGNGVGVVVLKMLDKAIQDNDHIHAVIKGSAINNDGAKKMNYVSPGFNGQVDVIKEALRNSSVEPASISYIESHGTATKIGDPIEIDALTKVFSDSVVKRRYCGLGSVKANIGHLDVAAGMASFIKVVLSLKNRKLPPLINFKKLNNKISLAGTPFYINTELKEWDEVLGVRRAGVSCFGVGGTNAHFILEEYQVGSYPNKPEAMQLVPLSAKNHVSLKEQALQLIRYLSSNDSLIANVAYTLATGRSDFECRKAFTANNVNVLLHKLEKFISEEPCRYDANKPNHAIWCFDNNLNGQFPNCWEKFEESRSSLAKRFKYEREKLSRELECNNGILSENGCYIDSSKADLSLIVNVVVLAKILLNCNILPGGIISNKFGLLVTLYLSECISLHDLIIMLSGSNADFDRMVHEINCDDMKALVAPVMLADGITAISVGDLKNTQVSGRLIDLNLMNGDYYTTFNRHYIFNVLTGVRSHDDSEIIDINKNILALIADEWEAGNVVELKIIYEGEQINKLPLPTYPFRREKYWVDPVESFADLPVNENINLGSFDSNNLEDVTSSIINCMSATLGVDDIEPDDNFFELGGDSFAAIDLISKISEKITTGISPSCVYINPTPNLIARLIVSMPDELDISIDMNSDQTSSKQMTSAEKRFWMLEKINPMCRAYLVPITFQLDGELSLPVLNRALSEMAASHECFRSSFSTDNGEPVKTIKKQVDFKLDIYNADGQLDGETIKNYFINKCLYPDFDFAHGPLVQGVLARVRDNKYYFGIVAHHILVDRQVMAIIVDELSKRYQNIIDGNDGLLSCQLPNLTIENVINQNDEVRFWKAYLNNLAELSSVFVPDYHCESRILKPSSRVSYHLNGDLFNKLSELASAEKATPFVVMLTAWISLLTLYASDEDLIIGYPVSQQSLNTFNRVLKPMINTVPFRIKACRDVSFINLLQDVHRQHVMLMQHSGLSFEEIIENCLGDNTSKSIQLINNFFVYQNTPDVNLNFSNIKSTPFDVELGYTQHDNTLIITPDNDGVSCKLEFNTDMYEHESMRFVLHAFVRLLNEVVKTPEESISSYNIGKETSLIESNSLGIENSSKLHCDVTVVSLFEGIVAQFPENNALIFESKIINYHELNSLCNQVARYLIELGVLPGDRVIVQAARSELIIVSILSILKIGGVYVPIAPCALRAKRERITHQIDPVLVISDCVDDFILFSGEKVIDIAALLRNAESYDRSNVKLLITKDTLAYVLYTSGTTGEPKGVVVSHGALVNNIEWRINAVNVKPNDRVLHTIAFSFDPSLWQILGPLCAGSTLIIASDKVHKDIDYFINLVVTHCVTILDFTPSLMRVFLNCAKRDQVRSVRHVFCGGEPLDAMLVEQFNLKFSSTLFNQYGPTETTIDALYWQVERNYDRKVLPIGRPISNVKVLILDSNYNICPVGAIGEIYIGGVGLAVGYYNDPDLTARKFLMLDDGSGNVARFYKTGDLGRCISSGNIEYYGRQDHQVKINGIRVNLLELNGVANSHPVVESSFSRIECKEGDRSLLVLYVKVKNGCQLIYEHLQKHLKNNLPSYLLPQVVKIVENFVFTESGKIDLKSDLINQPQILNINGNNFVICSEIEKSIAEIFAEVLAVPRMNVTRDFDFFANGGTSLNSIYAVSRLKSKHGIQITVEELFKNPKLVDLARTIDNKSHQTKLPNNGSDRFDEIPASFSQKYIHQNNFIPYRSIMNHVPVIYCLRGVIDLDHLQIALNAMISENSVLRTCFSERDGMLYQKVMDSHILRIDVQDLHIIDQLEFFNAGLERIINIDFDYTQPLLKCHLLNVPNDSPIIVFVFHRLIYDGMTEKIFINDFFKKYHLSLSGVCTSTSIAKTHYNDYVRDELTNVTPAFVDYAYLTFKKSIGDSILKLPFGVLDKSIIHESPKITFSESFRSEVIEVINKVIKNHNTTKFIFYLSFIKRCLGRLLDQKQVLLVTPVHGRYDEKYANVVGRFANLTFLPISLNKNESLSDSLYSSRQSLFGMLSYQELPILKLIDRLENDHKNLSLYMPQIFFGYFEESMQIELVGSNFEAKKIQFSLEKPEFPLAIDIIESSDNVVIDVKFISMIDIHIVKSLEAIIQSEISQIRRYLDKHTKIEAEV